MGYETDFEIIINHADRTTRDRILSSLETIADYSFEEGSNRQLYLCAKWYTHEEDMKKLSMLFPNQFFKVHGTGEDSRDLWECYYVNGKRQFCVAKITFDPFDEDKLK